MKKTMLILAGVLFFSIATVGILYFLSDDLNHRRNNFIRLFPPHPVLESKILDVQYNSYYIAGSTSDAIYLGNSTAPLHMIVANTMLTDTQHIQLKIKDPEKLKTGALQVAVDSPYFYVMDGITPAIFRGKVTEWVADRYMYDSLYFTDSVPISATAFAIRTLSSSTREHVLGKETADTPHVKLAPGLLQKQVDGIFCTDGMLHYNKALASLVYVYFYRNEYICIDTNMNLLYRGKTIDTVSRAQIKVAQISSDNSVTLSAPPLTVNKQSCVSGNWLFVHSNLLAKNESKELFNNAAVIDVYNLRNGVYKFSFYLFDFNEKKLKDFNVFGNKLIAIYDRYVVTYDLVPKYFDVY